MLIKEEIYKSNRRYSIIQSCTLNKKDIKELCEILKEKHGEIVDIEIREYKYPDSINELERKKKEEQIRKDFKFAIQIFGSNGSYLTGENSSVFDDKDFPKNLNLLNINNSFAYKYFRGCEPRNSFEISINFSETSIFYFGYPVEPINSIITVSGSNETWVTGTYQKIIDYFNSKKTSRNWIYGPVTWDIFLYTIVYPTTLWLIYKIDHYIKFRNINVSTALSFAIYLYIFIILVHALRMIYNYSKWLYPFMEYKIENSKKLNQRKFLYAILSIIFGPLIYDVIKTIFLKWYCPK